MTSIAWWNASDSGKLQGCPDHDRQDTTPGAATLSIGAGTSEIRRMLIGRELFEATA